MMNRRDFLRRTATLLGAGALAGRVAGAAAPKYASDVVALGQTSVRPTRLALGTGTGGWGGRSEQTTSLGVRGLADLLEYGYDRGLCFWDAADQYGSHPHLREALRRVPRDRVTILTKTTATTAAEARADLDRFRRELGVDSIDVLLLHCVSDPDWPVHLRPVMDVIAQAKANGVVKAHGISCHALGALQAAAGEPWVEVDLARINPAGAFMDAAPETVLPILQRMKKSGKGVIGMKIFGCGTLSHRAEECLRFILAQPAVDCFTIGVRSRDELDRLLRFIPANS